MKRLTLFMLFLCFLATEYALARPAESVIPSRYAFKLTRIMLKDGTIRTGWLVGTIRDSVVLQVGTKSEHLAHSDLLRVSIETQRNRSGPTLAGAILGVYLGDAIALRAEGQSSLFVRDHESAVAIALYSVLFGLAGGGIGYAASMAESGETTIDFSRGDEENAAAWARLAGSQEEERRGSAFHLSMQAASVSGPLPKADEKSYFQGSDVSPWNMLRRLQLTYTVADFAEVGIARMWLGQPSIWSYGYWPDGTNTNVRFNGTGYYLVGVFQPLWKLSGPSVRWDVGAGMGIASCDLSGTSTTNIYSESPVSASVSMQKDAFSAMAYTELKVFVTGFFTIGLTADVVMLQEDVPLLPGVKFDAETLGTSSIGVVLGLHF